MENAVLASAMAIAAGATDQAIIEGLETASIEPGRDAVQTQTLLIDDTYNESSSCEGCTGLAGHSFWDSCFDHGWFGDLGDLAERKCMHSASTPNQKGLID